jgi:hypothetical protein
LAAGNGKLIIEDNEITCRIVEGEEEEQFWKEANEKRATQRTQKYGGKRGHHVGQKRKYDRNHESKSPKKVKDTSTN